MVHWWEHSPVPPLWPASDEVGIHLLWSCPEQLRILRITDEAWNSIIYWYVYLRALTIPLSHIFVWLAGMVQWWEHSPSTTVAQVQFQDPASHVHWVCCWFSSLLRKSVFSGSSSFPPSARINIPNFNSTWNSGQEEPPRGLFIAKSLLS